MNAKAPDEDHDAEHYSKPKKRSDRDAESIAGRVPICYSGKEGLRLIKEKETLLSLPAYCVLSARSQILTMLGRPFSRIYFCLTDRAKVNRYNPLSNCWREQSMLHLKNHFMKGH